MGSKKKRSRRSMALTTLDPSTLVAREPETKALVSGKRFISEVSKGSLIAFGALVLVVSLVYAAVSARSHPQSQEAAIEKSSQPAKPVEPSDFDGSYIPTPLTYNELVKLSPKLLDNVNVGLMDLLCAQGLPGSENLNIDENLHALSSCAEDIGRIEEANASQFDLHPGLYRHSRAYYKAVVLVSELNAWGVHVDEERSNDEPNATFFEKSGPIFINGLLGDRHAGTCSSIPILIVAISQRLGYPVKLVCNSNHFFARWDDGKDRFNIEATVLNGGMESHPDAYYRYWPRMMKDTEITNLGYLQNMDGRHELAFILGKKLICLKVNKRKDEANVVYERIKQLLPSVDMADLTGAFNLD